MEIKFSLAFVMSWLFFAPSYLCTVHASEAGRQLSLPDSFHFDNDEQLGTDRDYSFGAQLGWHGDKAEHMMLNTFFIMDRMNELLGFSQQPLMGHPVQHTVNLGMIAFTPDNIRSSVPQTNDRPFASLFYTSSSKVSWISENGAIGSLLSIGMLGLSVTERLQNGFHALIRSSPLKSNPRDAIGWQNQVSDGGEPTAMYQLSYYKRVYMSPGWIDAAVSMDVQLGYFTETSLAAAMKLGWFDKQSDHQPFWNMFNRLHPQGSGGLLANSPELYLTLGARVRAVAYNALLQGGFRNGTAPLLSASEVERLVYELHADLILDMEAVRLALTLAYRTKEHKRAKGRSHGWIGLNLYW